MSRLTSLRDCAWLTAERTRVYSLMLVVGFVAMAAWIVGSQVFIYHTAYLLGGDFLSFYTASKMALGGHAVDAWHGVAHLKVERSLSPGVGYLAFFYPPAYLMLIWPLALLPYPLALLAWIGVTTGAAVFLFHRLLKRFAPDMRIGLLPLLAFPAVVIDIGCGQNGALSLAILTGGCLMLDRRPWLAGAILGLLVIKPQLAIVLPVVLAAAALTNPERWKTFLATGLSAALLCALAWPVVGNAGYAAFFASSAEARETLAKGMVDPAEMQSLYAALRVLKTPFALAMSAQILMSLGVIAATAWAAWRYRPDAFALMALTVAATVLATPFLLDYDLLVTALPVGWLLVSGARDGTRPWERTIALLAFFLPLVSRPFAQNLGLPLAPVILFLLFVAVAARIRAMATHVVVSPKTRLAAILVAR